eukprot:Nk52_evm72s485 gene=Nk52_evmTU72s485
MSSQPSDIFGWDLNFSPPNISSPNGNDKDGYPPSPSSTAYKRETIKTISVGEHHLAMLTADGQLLVYGSGPDGELGLGQDILVVDKPMQAKNFRCSGFLTVSCGMRHTAAISTSGKLLTWGSGFRGMLGTGGRDNVYTPMIVARTSYKTFVSVCCTERTTIALTETGVVYVMGDGFEGRLGIGSEQVSVIPACVRLGEDRSKVKGIFTGHDCSGCINDAGNTYIWGNGQHGQLGTGQLKNRCTPQIICEDLKIVSACGGDGFTIFIDEHGSAFGVGLGSEGQLGSADFKDSTSINPISTIGQVTSVSCGIHHSVFITKDDRVLVCGNGLKVPRIVHIEDIQDDDCSPVSKKKTKNIQERFKETSCGFTQQTAIVTYFGYLVFLDHEGGGFKFSVVSRKAPDGSPLFEFREDMEISASKYLAHRCSIMVLQNPTLGKKSSGNRTGLLGQLNEDDIIDIMEDVKNDDLTALINSDRKVKKVVTVTFPEDPVTEIRYVEARKKPSRFCTII